MKQIGLFYFSGTQSTYYVAKKLRDELQLLGHEVSIFKLEKYIMGLVKVDTMGYDMLGIISPIYGFRTPHIIQDFIELLPMSHKKVFLIKTASDYFWFNQSASVKNIHLLKKKWYDVFYDRTLVTCSNWLYDYDEALVKRFYEINMSVKIPDIARDIHGESRRLYHKNYFRDALTSITSFLEDRIGAKLFGKSLYTNKNCTHCELCSKRCPMDNIHFVNGKFTTKWRCTWCMKCIYSCRESAIQSRGFNVFIFKNGFNYRYIIQNRNLNTKRIHPSRHLKKYIDDTKL